VTIPNQFLVFESAMIYLTSASIPVASEVQVEHFETMLTTKLSNELSKFSLEAEFSHVFLLVNSLKKFLMFPIVVTHDDPTKLVAADDPVAHWYN
jgi:hypothetical protein